MSLSRYPSSATFIVEKRKKIRCFSGLRPVVNAIRSVLPGRRVPRNSSTSSFYAYLPAADSARPASVSEDIFSRPPSPASRPFSPVQSEESIGLNDNIVESDNDSILTIDIFESSNPASVAADIFSRPPSPFIPYSDASNGLDDKTVEDDRASLLTIDIFPTSTHLESLHPTEEGEGLSSRPSSPSIPSESSFIDGLLEEDNDSIYSNDLFPINFEPISSPFPLLA